MVSSEHLDIETMWEKLLNFPASGIYPSDYLLLLGALDAGWRVIEPVQELIYRDRNETYAFLFNLRHTYHRGLRTLKIQENDAVNKMISDEKWKITYGVTDGHTHWPTEIF